MHPDFISIEEEGVGRTWSSQGKGALVGSVGSGDRATVSISGIFAITYGGEVMRRLVVSSRMMKRYVGREGEYLSPSADHRIDLRATLDFFTNMRSRDLSYLRRRRFRFR
jgi:hypothetical protein